MVWKFLNCLMTHPLNQSWKKTFLMIVFLPLSRTTKFWLQKLFVEKPAPGAHDTTHENDITSFSCLFFYSRAINLQQLLVLLSLKAIQTFFHTDLHFKLLRNEKHQEKAVSPNCWWKMWLYELCQGSIGCFGHRQVNHEAVSMQRNVRHAKSFLCQLFWLSVEQKYSFQLLDEEHRMSTLRNQRTNFCLCPNCQGKG